MAERKVIVANYRYFVSGGPEVYLFKFMERCGDIGYAPIPFSVRYGRNKPTPYDRYFIGSRGGDSVYYHEIRRTPKAICKTLQGAYYNPETVKNLCRLIDEERPQVLYALQVINTLSPSIFKAAKERGLKVVHRVSDFNLVCPRSDLLSGEEPCRLCVGGDVRHAVEHRCCHGSRMATFIRCEAMKYHRRKDLYRYVDYFVTPTEFTRNILIEGGFDANKVVKVPTFIDSAAIVPCYTHENYLLFPGRLVPEKGAKYAVDAMRYLARFPGLRLKITGERSECGSEIEALLKEHDLEKAVDFVGFCRGSELEELMRGAACILCPAIWYENMPNTVPEAYAYGKPVIASRIGCFPELIEDGTTGLLFRPKDARDLADKIAFLLENEDVRLRMGRAARKKAELDFSPAVHMERLKELFER